MLEDARTGDCAWKLAALNRHDARDALADGVAVAGGAAFPATWENLLRLKNAVQEHDGESTIFPTAGANLGRSTLGIGARFTTLHWPAVDWAMSALGLGVTANQNSIPRELVYDVDAMLEGRLDTVPFPFIGTSVPEGHQGQSVEGMSHGSVLGKLKTGFHRRRIAWSFNADHQPIGGKFDAREDALVRGCILASYITFDLSPELAQTQVPADPSEWVKAHVPTDLVERVRARVASIGLAVDEQAFAALLAYVWPSMEKMKRRDDKYRAVRAQAFTTDAGRRYLRELSIDELPGQTPAGTTAVMLSLCEALGIQVNFVAPAFGFQKNTPYPDNGALRALIEKQWSVCRAFDASIGFHSGSGKSAENYRVMGEVTGGRLEIKTSGRYTYEMGAALASSRNAADAALWHDWYRFTLEMALAGAFSSDATEQKMARTFVATSLETAGVTVAADVFDSPATCRARLEALSPSPAHMFFFEYNFLYVLAAGRQAGKVCAGRPFTGRVHAARAFLRNQPGGAAQFRESDRGLHHLSGRDYRPLRPAACTAATVRLEGYTSLTEMLDDI